MDKLKCQLCNSEMSSVDKKTIANTNYIIWKCSKCKHTVAKSSLDQ
jgi:ribosomal protein L37AE/L43A